MAAPHRAGAPWAVSAAVILLTVTPEPVAVPHLADEAELGVAGHVVPVVVRGFGRPDGQAVLAAVTVWLSVLPVLVAPTRQ